MKNKKSKKELQLIKYIKTNKQYLSEFKNLLLKHLDKIYIWPSNNDRFSCLECGAKETSNWIEPDNYDMNTIVEHFERCTWLSYFLMEVW